MSDPQPPVSGHEDIADQAPWAMQLVIHVPKQDPPTLADAAVAAAQAVVGVLAHADAADNGPWVDPIARWHEGRIRKVVRRARGASWDRCQMLPGVTVTHGTAQVRAFVPGPTDTVPAELARLQVRGTELPGMLPTGASADSGALAITVNPELRATAGKLAAQVGHASNIAWLDADECRRHTWRTAGFPLHVVDGTADQWQTVVADADVRVVDAGFTEIPAGTMTCVASWI